MEANGKGDVSSALGSGLLSDVSKRATEVPPKEKQPTFWNLDMPKRMIRPYAVGKALTLTAGRLTPPPR